MLYSFVNLRCIYFLDFPTLMCFFELLRSGGVFRLDKCKAEYERDALRFH